MTGEELIKLTDSELEAEIKKVKGRLDIHASNQLLRDALRAYVLAQSRMRDKWAEGDDAVKNKLWKDLHACEDRARLLIQD